MQGIASLTGDQAWQRMLTDAAAAKAAGDGSATSQLLRRATAQQRSTPTYYGGAWNALGQALLTSSTFSSC